jgi:hypothetical protein
MLWHACFELRVVYEISFRAEILMAFLALLGTNMKTHILLFRVKHPDFYCTSTMFSWNRPARPAYMR